MGLPPELESHNMSMVDDQPRATEVKEVLHSILESHHFKTSKQCQDLLRYIVHRSLKGDDASLRERIIGIEVFGRQPNYDTSEDPVVRVRAADVRKRLAQYYQSLAPGTPALHIDLQPGCYRVHFRVDPPTDQTAFPARTQIVEPSSTLPDLHVSETPPGVEGNKVGPQSRWRSRRLPAAAFLFLAIVGIGAWIAFDLPTPQQRFWAPVAANKQPVLFYVGSNAAYALSAEFLAEYRAEHGLPNSGPESYVDFPPNSTVQASDLIAVHDTFVTTGDLAAAVQLATLMTAWKRPYILRSGRDLLSATSAIGRA
jgi:hypothetical protein